MDLTDRPISRRDMLRFAVGALAVGASAACQPGQPVPQPTPSPEARRAGPTLILATSELVVGPNRFAVGILDDNNRPIVDARVTFGFFQVDGQQATKRGESPATFRWVDQETRGIYTAPVTFDAPGRWGVETTIEQNGQRQVIRSPFEVKASGSAPMIGSPAIRSKSVTLRDVKDATELCTAAPPCDLHATSLDELLANGKPTVVLFASPGYCSSQTCAPQLGVLQGVRPQYGESINFHHVEVFKDPRNQILADAVTEWRLPSEPWIFFMDRSGMIVERYDGIATAEEIQSAIARIA